LQILATSFCNGKTHDFKLFKDSRLSFAKTTKLSVDTGYAGIHTWHSNIEIPKKRTKKNPLSKQDKTDNKAKSSKRIFVEHVIGCIKRFRILSETYRNRRKRFSLRFNLISGIYNFELASRNLA